MTYPFRRAYEDLKMQLVREHKDFGFAGNPDSYVKERIEELGLYEVLERINDIAEAHERYET